MANEFKIKKGLIVEGASGGTVVDVQGSQGQLFSVTDNLSGSIFAVSDISGVPIFDVNSNGGSVFTGLVSGITPVVADNFVTKGYVDGTGGGTGPFLPLAAGSGSPLTGDLYQTMGAIGVAQTDQDYIAKIYELNADGFLSLYTGQPTPLERIRISSYGDSFFVPANNGKIGIGTTTPLAKLQVGLSTSNTGNRSSLAMFGAAESGILNALSLVNTTGAAATGYGTRINFHLSSNYSPTGCIEVVTEDLTSNATDSTMRFSTYGTIGGSTTYQSRLEISSAGAIKFNDYGAGTLVTDANGNISVSSGGGAGGPYLPLSAGSGERVTGDLYISDKLYMRPSSTYGNGYKVMHVTGTGNAPYPTIINFSNYAKPSVMVINDENVGIGITNPSAKLHIANEGEGEFAGANSSGAGGSHLILKDEGSTSRTLMSGPSVVFQTPANADGTNVWATSRVLGSPAAAGSARGTISLQVRDQYDPFNDGTSWNWRTALTAINTGNVGIGTNAPSETLSVPSGEGAMFGFKRFYSDTGHSTSRGLDLRIL